MTVVSIILWCSQNNNKQSLQEVIGRGWGTYCLTLSKLTVLSNTVFIGWLIGLKWGQPTTHVYAFVGTAMSCTMNMLAAKGTILFEFTLPKECNVHQDYDSSPSVICGQILTILFSPSGFTDPTHFYIMRFSNISILIIPDESYSKKSLCSLCIPYFNQILCHIKCRNKNEMRKSFKNHP